MTVAVGRTLKLVVLAMILSARAMAQAPVCAPLPEPPGFPRSSNPGALTASYPRLLHVRTVRGVDTMRRELRERVLGHDALSRALPTVDALKAGDPQPIAVSVKAGVVQRLTVDMTVTRAIAYYFAPAHPSRELVIYHSGHEGVVPAAMVTSLLDAGHAVVAMYMPALGPNAEYAPVIDVPDVGRLPATVHDHYELLERSGVKTLRLFVEPVSIVLNHLLRDGRFDTVTLIGLSGGGWTATVAAALDPRITHSYAIAGSVPLPLRWDDRTSWGDFEQRHPSLSGREMDLYLLAAYGAARSHTQILHKYDTCCFAVPAVPAYVGDVTKRLEQLGAGRYEFILDDTIVGHQVSPCTFARILADLAAR